MQLRGEVRWRTAFFAPEELFQVPDQFSRVWNLDGGDRFVVLAFQLGGMEPLKQVEGALRLFRNPLSLSGPSD